MRTSLLSATLLSALLATSVQAQQAALTLAAGRVADASGAASDGVVLAPSMGWRGGVGEAAVGAQGVLFPGREAVSLGGWAQARLEVVRAGGAALELGASGSGAGATGGYRAATGTLAPRLRVGGAGWTAAAGPELVTAGVRSTAAGGGGWGGLFPPAAPTTTTRWRSAVGAAAEAAAAHGLATLRGGWRTLHDGELRWNQWTAAAQARAGRVELSLGGGVQTGAVRERWLQGGVGVEVGGGATLLLEAGHAPSDPLTGRARAGYASAGLSLRRP